MDFDRGMWLSCNKSAQHGVILRKRPVISTHSPDTQSDTGAREQGAEFMPRFDGAGLVTAVVLDSVSSRLLMVAHMDAEAIAQTRKTGLAHFHSRSRGRLWMKGESSGHVLKVIEICVDCDQDALELRVEPAGPACHTLAPSCFYRRLTAEGALERIQD
jgi:phosphoribosyl-AMP cyclohydrolase